MTLSKTIKSWLEDLLDHFKANNRWRRLLKYNLAMTVAVTIAILPSVIRAFGVDTFFIPLQVVFSHPAQRVGSMIETQILVLSGVVVGTAWGLLGLYLSGLVVDSNINAAFAIRAIFALCSAMTHGFLRSSTPKLFSFVWFLLMTSFIILLARPLHFTVSLLSLIMYPVLTGQAIVTFFGLVLYPDSSSSFLGEATIHALSETFDTLSKATSWFIASEAELEHVLTRPLTKLTTVDTSVTYATLERKQTTALSRMRSVMHNPVAHMRSKKPEEKKKKKDKEPEEPEEDESPLLSLTNAKADLRHSLNRCKDVQREVNFELSYSALPLDILRPITTEGMASLVQETIRIVGACENKLVMIEEEDEPSDNDNSSVVTEKSAPPTARHSQEMVDAVPEATSSGIFFKRPPGPARTHSTPKEEFLEKLKLVKPTREIEACDADLLEAIVSRIRGPTKEFQVALKEAVSILITSLAYCYDVPELPSGAKTPKGVLLEEVDMFIDSFEKAISTFDEDSMDEFRQFTGNKDDLEEEDILPQFETFLVSSFLLGLRQTAIHILQMLRYARHLVEARKRRNDKPRVYWPRFTNWAEWLSLGGEDDAMVLPKKARKRARSGAAENGNNEHPTYDADTISIRTDRSIKKWRTRDTEAGRSDAGTTTTRSSKKPKKKSVRFEEKHRTKKPGKESWIMKIRGKAADAIEWVRTDDDLEYALKLCVAVALVSWPGFLPSWHIWYTNLRGVWAPLQLILVFEVAIGTSLFVFFMRLLGVILGCTLGYAAFAIGSGNHAVAVIILMLGIIPSTYMQVETKYVKSAIVCITTSTVVACASFNKSGVAVVNFYARLVSFLIGGVVAIFVEICLYPVRARDRLIESLSSALRELVYMQGAVSFGIDDPELKQHSTQVYSAFESSRNKTQAALAAAETFLPFCVSEPRLKGDFKALVPVYAEIIFVLHQILDRMDNVVSLRKNYGFSILEDFNPVIYTYRRNVAGGVTLSIFAVNEALTTRLPLPQYLPSNRTAQLRLIHRVREVVASRRQRHASAAAAESPHSDCDSSISSLDTTAQIAARHKILSWNAATAGHMEIIEYVEELVELAKLIVGVNAFRGGILAQPDFGTYIRRGSTRFTELRGAPHHQGRRVSSEGGFSDGAGLRRAATYSGPVPRWVQRRKRAIIAGGGKAAAGKMKEAAEGEEVAAAAAVGDHQVVVPGSLRRVGTRFRRDATVSRRMGTLAEKGKGMERS